MGKIDLARRAEIGREKRARTRAQIVEAGLVLLAERPPEALTVDAIVEAAGVAKGTFYYHFQSIEELVAAVVRSSPIALTSFWHRPGSVSRIPSCACPSPLRSSWRKPSTTPSGPGLWSEAPKSRRRSSRIREHLKADLAEAIAQGRVTIQDVELAADIVIGVWLQVTRGILRGAPPRTLPAKLSTPCLEPLAHPKLMRKKCLRLNHRRRAGSAISREVRQPAFTWLGMSALGT